MIKLFQFYTILFLTNFQSFECNFNNQTNILIKTNFTSNELVTQITSAYRQNNMKKILNLLMEEQANSCVYGENPKLSDLCPNVFEKKPLTFLNKFKDISFKNVFDSVLNESIVKSLKEKCAPGEWCLESNLIPLKEAKNRANLMTFNSELYCLFESCLESMKKYIQKCVHSELTRDILFMTPGLCNFNMQTNQYCPEHTMRLIHVSVAALTNKEANKLQEFNVCEEDILRKRCSKECKKIAFTIDRLESCCYNSNLIKTYKPFNWYFDFNREVQEYCNLPITSICWSDGKYFIGISPNILVLSIIASVTITTFVFVMIYMVCCKRLHGVKQPFNDSYEYSELHQNGEVEELSLAHSSFNDDLKQENYKKSSMSNMLIDDEKIDFNNNEHISPFLNQNRADTRSLLS